MIDLIGKKHGRLLPIKKGLRRYHYLCRCDCGAEKEISQHCLMRGTTLSCGCLQREISTTHGKSNHLLYGIWVEMKKRCGIIKGAPEQVMANYNNRGICLCKEWLEFISFYEWAKDKWKKGLQIDRRDNNGNYTPENCRFVTKIINCQNARKSKRWYIKGVKYNSATEAATACGVTPTTIRNWCYGQNHSGYSYPPKPDCYSLKLYPK